MQEFHADRKDTYTSSRNGRKPTQRGNREAIMDFTDLTDAEVEQAIGKETLLIAFRKKAKANEEANKLCDKVEDRLRDFSPDGKLMLVRMDVDSNPEIKERFGILSVPNVVLFRGGVAVRAGWIGPWREDEADGQENAAEARPDRAARTLEEFLKRHLNSAESS